MSNVQPNQQALAMTDLDTIFTAIFTRFPPQDIEGFLRLYQLWYLRHKREKVVAQLNDLKRQIQENEVHLKTLAPSVLAQATLSQFRANGVEDIDLLDRMLERGDEWLDHTLQLFEHCVRLDMLQGSVTEWCIHALEGAYDWIESMGNIEGQHENDDTTNLTSYPTFTNQSSSNLELLPATTEADFLLKLMSEDGEDDVEQENRRTRHLLALDISNDNATRILPSLDVPDDKTTRRLPALDPGEYPPIATNEETAMLLRNSELDRETYDLMPYGTEVKKLQQKKATRSRGFLQSLLTEILYRR